MIAETSRFGKIEYGKSEIITMVRGILGFDENIRFIVVNLEGQEPFKWLQSLEDPDLAFLMIEPTYLNTGYIVEINPNDLITLKANSVDEIAIYVLVSIPRNRPSLMSANLQAPIAINKNRMKAMQLVLSESDYLTDQAIFDKLEQRFSGASLSDND